MDGVVAREGGGLLGVAGADEGADAGEDAEDVGAGGTALEVFAGGFEDEVDFRAGGDGLEGRAVRKGDRLPLGRAAASPARRVRPDRIPAFPGEAEVAVILGPQDDRFTRAGIDAFLGGPYEILPQSDRMGARLKGPFIEHTRGHDIISDGVPMGGVQVIGEGQPIVLLADRQSAGGYTKIATVCSFDLGRIGQVKPGGRLRFRRVTVAEAHAMLRDSRRALDTAIE